MPTQPAPIIYAPNPVLRQKAKKVTVFNDDLKQTVETMIATMRSHRGIGLAASQIDQPIQLVVAEYIPEDENDPDIPLTVLVNPTITDSGSQTDWLDEGCLSMPYVEIPVKRPTSINVLAQDLEGNRIKIRAKDMLARILQHEIDHTNGILIPQRSHPKLTEIAGKRIVFFGTPNHARAYISTLAATDLNIVGVVTETDKPTGRGQLLSATPVKELAVKMSIPVFQFDTLDGQTLQTFKELEPDVAIVVAYGKILPESWLSVPKHGFLNIHYSLLPKYRGASPHQTAILNGEKEAGYTIFKLDKGMDTGPTIYQEKLKIEPFDTSNTLLHKLTLASVNGLLNCLPGYLQGTLKPKDQEGTATKTKLFTKIDGLIDWNKPVEVIDRQIRALTPWPGTYTELEGERLIIHSAHLEKNRLTLDVVQPSGKQAMNFSDWLRGNRVNWLTFLRETDKLNLDHY